MVQLAWPCLKQKSVHAIKHQADALLNKACSEMVLKIPLNLMSLLVRVPMTVPSMLQFGQPRDGGYVFESVDA